MAFLTASRLGDYATIWRGYTRPERTAFLRAFALLPVVDVGLRCVGYRRLAGWLSRPLVHPHVPHANAHQIDAIVNAVAAATRHQPLRSSCLARSIVLWRELRAWGVATDLRIGVAQGRDGFAAHAWVEHQGRVLNDAPRVRREYAMFDARFDPAAWRER